MAKIQKHAVLLILLVLGIAVFIRGIYFLDPDFGWHFRMGQIIVKSGIPGTDPLSYTMPSYPFIDHEWLSNVIIFFVYSSFGIYPLSLIFTIVYVLALYLSVPTKYKNYALLPLVLAGAIMVNFSGVRTQVTDWLFLAIILRVYFDDNLWKKWKYLVPFIFLPWANLHGGFAYGIAIILIIFLAKSLERKKVVIDDLKILLFSILVTFINPYGLFIWHEIWMQATDTSLHWRIGEWVPTVFYFDIAFCVLFAVSFFFLLIYRSKIKPFKIAVYLCLLLMAISSLRNIPLWAISSIFITAETLSLFWERMTRHKENVLRFGKIKNILILLIVLVAVYEVYTGINSDFNINNYPVQAVNFLKKENIEGNIFATYDIGGYLVWQLPQKKDFIDGRMASWRWQANLPNQSDYAFNDYIKMLNNEGFFKLQIKKYNIDFVLFPEPGTKKKTWLDQQLSMLENRLFPNQDEHILNEDLTKLGFLKIYNDGKYVVYKRLK